MACLYWAEAQPGGANAASPDSAVSQAYRRACDGDSAAAGAACARSAALQLERASNSAEAQEPLQSLDALCEHGTGAACCALVKVYSTGRVVAPDPARVSRLHAQTCPTCCDRP